MATSRPVKVGVGLRDKRARIVRSLDAHLRWLTVVESMGEFVPPERAERPPRPADPFPYRADMRGRKWSPREKPAIAYPLPGAEAITEETMKAYIAVDPFIRGGLREATVRALCYLESFAPARTPEALAAGPSHSDAAAALARLVLASPHVGDAGSRARWDYLVAIGQIEARLATLEAALELPLLFHAGGPWDEAKRARWTALTGEDDATTRVMGDAIRTVLPEALAARSRAGAA